MIYTPPIDSRDGVSVASSDAPPSPNGLLATPDSEYPLSFSYDFSPYTIEPSSPVPPSHWEEVEGINEWVDLERSE